MRCLPKMKPRLRAQWVMVNEELGPMHFGKLLLSPMSRNSASEEFRDLQSYRYTSVEEHFVDKSYLSRSWAAESRRRVS